ncbi:MAG: hypothetical protein QOJ35_422 [Solirubrobacteraceae bacterium]|nr:hypothetical protein [Solirubrobacteraceae bacterium]
MSGQPVASVRSPLVGRDVELDRVLSALDDVIAGAGRIVLVSGEPGIGKTRLVEELTALASEQGALAAWGRVDDADGAPPYWPWVQLLDGVLDAIEREVAGAALADNAAAIAAIVPSVARFVERIAPLAPLDPAAARFRLHDAIVDVLRLVGGHRPLVLVVDDLHWADVASLELTRFVAARLASMPMLLVLTYRTVDAVSSQPFDDVLGSLARQPALARIALAGLTEPEVGRFIAQTIGLRPRRASVTAVHARTEGNPFFVAELARLLHSERRLGPSTGSSDTPVPVGVRDVVRRRLLRLPDATNELLVLGAVVGREFDSSVLATAAKLDAGDVFEHVEPALRAGVLTEAAGAVGRLRFSHALIRDTIYEELSSLRRATLHARVGDALAQRPGSGPSRVAELARHFLHAAPVLGPGRGLGYALEAAEAAQVAVSYERAEDELRRALSLVELLPAGADRRERELDVQNRLVALMILTRGFAAAEVGLACARARELAEEIEETDALFTALTNLANFHHVHGDLSVAMQMAGQLLAIGRRGAHARWLTAGQLFLGMAQFQAGRLLDARETFATLRTIAATLDLSVEVAESFFGLHPMPMALLYSARCAWTVGEEAEAHAFADEGVRVAAELAHPHTLAFAWYFASHLEVLVEDAPRVLESTARGIAFCDQHGLASYHSAFRFLRGWAISVDHPDEGVGKMEEQLAVEAGGARISLPFHLGLLADGEARRGNHPRALALVDEALAGIAEIRLREPDLHRRRGELLAAQGPEHHAAAAAALRKAIAIAQAQGAVPFATRAMAALAILEPADGVGAGVPIGVPSNLTVRERELLGLLGRGLTDKQIASELVISLATVRSHLDRTRDKTRRRRRAELTRLALELGLTAH